MMKYVLFGTGDYYKRFKHWFNGRNVIAVLDNDPKKQGTIFDGYPVMAPTDINSIEYDAIVILSFYITEMKKQLIELGVAPERIFHFYDLQILYILLVHQYLEFESLIFLLLDVLEQLP